MQYESQIQNDEWICTESCGDNTEKVIDSRPVIQYYCNKCNKCVKKAGYNAEYTHEQHIRECWPNGIEGIDYVECRLCKFAGLKITIHVKKEHNIERSEYEEKYGPLKCSKSLEKIKTAAKNNGDWINRKKEEGEDLSEYKSKMGVAVSQSIMSNSEERARRAELMGQLNKRDDARERSSKAAKITSARPEILENRAKQLKNWRDENPEEFYENCLSKMISNEIKMTNPEKILQDFLKIRNDYQFKWSQIIISETFTPNKTLRKQIDFGDHNKKIYVEFDGIRHFKCVQSKDEFERTQKMDVLLNEYIELNNCTLIRISYDQYKNLKFKPECLERLNEILDNPVPGVHYIGTAYNKG